MAKLTWWHHWLAYPWRHLVSEDIFPAVCERHSMRVRTDNIEKHSTKTSSRSQVDLTKIKVQCKRDLDSFSSLWFCSHILHNASWACTGLSCPTMLWSRQLQNPTLDRCYWWNIDILPTNFFVFQTQNSRKPFYTQNYIFVLKNLEVFLLRGLLMTLFKWSKKSCRRLLISLVWCG